MNFKHRFFQILQKIVKLKHFKSNGYSTNVTPIEMAFDVYESGTTSSTLPPLVSMHGYLGSKENLKTLCRHLEKDTRRKIYAVDARNHGQSPHAEAHTMEHIAADILLFMDKEKIRRVAILGHSMGGRAMTFFALKNPENVEKAIIADMSPFFLPPDIRNTYKLLNIMRSMHIAPNLSLNEGRKLAKNNVKGYVRSEDYADFIVMNLEKSKSGEFSWKVNLNALIANFEKTFDSNQFKGYQFKGPILFIFGNKSPFYSPDDWPKIKNLFPAAEKILLESGHLVHIHQRAKFVEAVSWFLKQ